MTQMGMILGTAAYMAPEQARGQGRRQARRHLGVWRRALRDADGTAAVRRRGHDRSAGRGRALGAAVGRAAADGPCPRQSGAPPVPAQGSEAARGRHPRCAPGARGRVRNRRASRRGAARGGRATVRRRLARCRGPSPRRCVVALGVALWAPWRSETPTDRPLVRLDVDLGADAAFPTRRQRQQCRHLARWHAAGLRLRQSRQTVHSPPGSTESDRASGHAGSRVSRSSPRTGSGSASPSAPRSRRSPWTAAPWSRWETLDGHLRRGELGRGRCHLRGCRGSEGAAAVSRCGRCPPNRGDSGRRDPRSTETSARWEGDPVFSGPSPAPAWTPSPSKS